MGTLSVETRKGGIKAVTLGINDALKLGGISQYRTGRYNSDGPEIADVIITSFSGSSVIVFSVEPYPLNPSRYAVYFNGELMLDSGARVSDRLEAVGIDRINELIKERAHKPTPGVQLEMIKSGVNTLATLTRRLFRGFSS